eukprot:SAG22_NODE_78_length_22065_cov_7.473095_5_plen_184_part_00
MRSSSSRRAPRRVRDTSQLPIDWRESTVDPPPPPAPARWCSRYRCTQRCQLTAPTLTSSWPVLLWRPRRCRGQCRECLLHTGQGYSEPADRQPRDTGPSRRCEAWRDSGWCGGGKAEGRLLLKLLASGAGGQAVDVMPCLSVWWLDDRSRGAAAAAECGGGGGGGGSGWRRGDDGGGDLAGRG